jgi:hypothetical protein
MQIASGVVGRLLGAPLWEPDPFKKSLISKGFEPPTGDLARGLITSFTAMPAGAAIFLQRASVETA